MYAYDNKIVFTYTSILVCLHKFIIESRSSAFFDWQAAYVSNFQKF